MSYKTYKPVTSSSQVTIDHSELCKDGPYKRLTCRIPNSGGRNNLGRITMRHRGGGMRSQYRIVDFKRDKEGVPAIVQRIEYDPNRNSHIALIKYDNGELSYIIAPQGLKSGDKVISGIVKTENRAAADIKTEIRTGNCLPIKLIPDGTLIHNIELKKNKGGQLARAAGTYAKLMSKHTKYANLMLRSGEIRKVLLECKATIGTVSNPEHKNIKKRKAGASRWAGRRPKVRGVAMNPVDHPLGGGEGKTSGGRHPVSPWGQLAKGKKTRRNKFTSKYIVKSRKVK